MRLIDSDALIKEICRDQCEMETKGCGSRCELVIYVDNTPIVDAVPVVRCKDCKWWEGKRWDSSSDPQYGYCHACKHAHYSENWEISIRRQYKANWYCADGERREDDAD